MNDIELEKCRVLAKVYSLTEVRDYNHTLLNIPAAWKSSKGRGVKVGILDTGCPQHDDLEVDKNWSAIEGYLHDQNGHGTHVAGLVAARENGHGVVGIAPECTINTYTVLNQEGMGQLYHLVKAINQAMEDGCRIINMSLGSPSPTDFNLLRTACDVATSKGIIIVAAAGNEAGKIDQPASYGSVIAVGALNRFKRRASFSNYGPAMDFAVGGVDVYSTYLANGYAKLSGTSMAAPVFSGLCALIIGEHIEREGCGKEVNTPIKDVFDMIEHIKRFSFDLGPEGFDEFYGHGMPIFEAPKERRTLTTREVMIRELDGMQESLDALRQAVEELK